MFNNPGDSLVLRTDFLHMVERVDVDIDFLKAHRHSLEAKLNFLRFEPCMIRAMPFVKMLFVASLCALMLLLTRPSSEKGV
ncbi:uncharacterized protein STEHIDRAFT_155097 [Stereum hirsutum FP-91666 SS1]|uniref:uncharacterized protein n=1 Tax=Stereum hirsutum (strain FP-91666) TaxID=721885 RepID=UPI000440E15C|nr:uncharacterized protein STEHIDRAFT_155097 [Stereum hirsutum FP-91666 SS1]EIM89437.1 hypothetical protein STEHIDRAFT_155097 [Stereum hirsutum FP-91666 SS1]